MNAFEVLAMAGIAMLSTLISAAVTTADDSLRDEGESGLTA